MGAIVCRLRSGLIALMLVTLSLSASPAIAASPGTGGWYWPTGTEDFGGMSGWWDDRGGSWHLAQDMAAPCGSSVYAIADGTVLESKYVGGYGAGGTDGGAVVILHKTASGTKFKALYGHVSNLRYEKGDAVRAGAVVGTVNNSSPNHLHFGIHPGEAYPRDNNPFRGHTYTSSDDYGFVNPVTFLRDNPRVVTYVAPNLPVVASVATTTTPFDVGVACGVAYWTERSSEGTQAWSYDIAERSLAQRSTEATHPPFDAKRYAVLVRTAPRGFVVRDRRPVLSLKAQHDTPQPGAAVSLSGNVTNAVGQPFQGASIYLQRLTGDGWMTIARAVSNGDGRYVFGFRPSSRTHLRVRFSPPDTYVTAVSATQAVAPHVTMSEPVVAATGQRNARAFHASGFLTPAHPRSSEARLLIDKYEDGAWVRVSTKRGYLSTADGRTRYQGRFRLDGPGTYRVRAYVPDDSGHAATSSPARVFSVD